MPADLYITYVKDKMLDGQRGGYFYGIHSELEDDNTLGVIDLAFEAELMAKDGKGPSRTGVQVVNIPMTFDDGDMYMEFDT
jgi:hypothetical protein